MSGVLGLDHVSILVSDAHLACEFYQEALGLEKLERPDLGFPGYWLRLGGQHQSLHLMQLTNPCQGLSRPSHGGRDNHFALAVAQLEVFMVKLEAMQVAYTLSRSGRKALFFRDLDNNAVELFEVGA
ncbi:VOC family protein [Thiomicrospira microaerophila]|uniref:VOC family protein n=1 Tax=Thiomicrospira microaerophila TaxID=406020 RepID=UPI00200D20CB|nr:VOC family protein [Thiomicrospira microaerophila]UQB41385.1 VOC family protein [Thiomicrospira microaerophila]